MKTSKKPRGERSQAGHDFSTNAATRAGGSLL